MTLEPYYHDEAAGITVYCGDCRDVLPLLDAVDHVITDPPYEPEAHTQGRRSGRGGDARKWGVAKLVVDFVPITDEMRSECGRNASRLARSWILVFCQVEAAMSWRCALEPSQYVRTQVWVKPDSTPQFTGDRPAMGYESIVTCWNGGGRPRWNGGGRRGVYVYGSKDPLNRPEGHATPKPLPLMRELIELFTDPGDLVLDPFAGSFTTGVACKELGRRFIGIELEQKWCEVGVRRLKNTEYKPPLFTLPPEPVVQPMLITEGAL